MIWENIVYETYIFEDLLSSAREHLEDVSAIKVAKLVLPFKDEKRDMIWYKIKIKNGNILKIID